MTMNDAETIVASAVGAFVGSAAGSALARRWSEREYEVETQESLDDARELVRFEKRMNAAALGHALAGARREAVWSRALELGLSFLLREGCGPPARLVPERCPRTPAEIRAEIDILLRLGNYPGAKTLAAAADWAESHPRSAASAAKRAFVLARRLEGRGGLSDYYCALIPVLEERPFAGSQQFSQLARGARLARWRAMAWVSEAGLLVSSGRVTRPAIAALSEAPRSGRGGHGIIAFSEMQQSGSEAHDSGVAAALAWNQSMGWRALGETQRAAESLDRLRRRWIRNNSEPDNILQAVRELASRARDTRVGIVVIPAAA
jgi:hypothetical protein